MRPSLLRGPLRAGIAAEAVLDLRERPLGALGGIVGDPLRGLPAAVFGTLLSRVYEAKVPGGSTSAIAHLTGAAHTTAVHGFVTAMDVVFLVAAGVMALAAVLAARLPAETQVAPVPAPQEPELSTA